MENKTNPQQTAHVGKKNENDWNDVTVKDAIGIVVLIVVAFALAMFYVAHYWVNEHSASIKFFTEATFSFLALIVVVIQVGIYAQQAIFMRQQVELSRQTFELLERPSLGVEVRVIPNEDQKGHSIRALVKNTGHLPSRLTTIIVAGVRGPAGASDEEAEAEIWPLDPPPGIMISKGIIPISGTATAFAYPVMTNQEFELVQMGRQELYGCVRIDYGMDGKTQPYFFEYYGRFSRHTDAFDILPTHNDAN